MAEPAWVDVGPGLLGVTLVGSDGHPVVLLKSLWEFKGTKHQNLEQNWDAFVAAITNADGVFESRRSPKENRIYVKSFPELVREDGRRAPGAMVVVVDRTRDVVVTTFIPDNWFGKVGRRLWP